jgi:hypothetical protein
MWLQPCCVFAACGPAHDPLKRVTLRGECRLLFTVAWVKHTYHENSTCREYSSAVRARPVEKTSQLSLSICLCILKRYKGGGGTALNGFTVEIGKALYIFHKAVFVSVGFYCL